MQLDGERRRTRSREPRRSGPLLYALREELGITSPKAGCQQGGCGTCTVLVDGEPRRSCLLPLAAVDGAAITTVEGIGTPEQLGPTRPRSTTVRLPVRVLHAGWCRSRPTR